MHDEPLVTAEWLAAHAADPRVCIADVRWYLSGKRGADAYAAGHIPGAVFVDLDAELSGPRGTSGARHPLPSRAQFAALIARLGAGPDSVIVAYDDAGGAIAARFWFLSRYFRGAPPVAVLDGGIDAWIAGGRLIEPTPTTRTPVAPPSLSEDQRLIVQADDLAAELARGAVLLDARAAERYQGVREPIDARPGHIPGARNAPFADNLRDGRFLPREALDGRYQSLTGLGPTIAYCGSGVTACHTLLALALCGDSSARLYPGSWSEWAADPNRPAKLGEDP